LLIFAKTNQFSSNFQTMCKSEITIEVWRIFSDGFPSKQS
jgi:hypothetical protein